MARTVAKADGVDRAELLEFIRPRHHMILSTVRSNGSPQMSPVTGGVDEQGRIVVQGLTPRPTRHRFTVAGQELYTWCALDTLIFPTILDRPASIESESPVSGHPIRVSVGENGVTSVQPETAVVSLVNPDDLTSIRSSFCNQVHYFTCAQDAAPWLAEHPEGQIVSVAEAHQLGAALTTQILTQLHTPPTAHPGCCS